MRPMILLMSCLPGGQYACYPTPISKINHRKNTAVRLYQCAEMVRIKAMVNIWILDITLLT